MDRSLEDQIRALAERSVAGALETDDRSGDDHGEAEVLRPYPPAMPGSAGRHRWLLVAAAVVVVGLVGGLAVWRHDDSVPVAVAPNVGVDLVPCVGSVPRRTVDPSAAVTADALPNRESSVTDETVAADALAAHEGELRSRYPDLTGVEVGPGFGRAWVGQRGAEGVDYQVVEVDDYGIVVRLPRAASCPQSSALYISVPGGVSGVPVFFVAPALSATDPDLAAAARWLALTAEQRTGVMPTGAMAVVTTADRTFPLVGGDPSCPGVVTVVQVTFDEVVTDDGATSPSGAAAPTGRAMQAGQPGPPGATELGGCGSFYGLTAEPLDLSVLGDPVIIDLSADPPATDTAVWELHPNQTVTSSSDSFTADVTRLACSDGITGFVGRPMIEADEQKVVVTFLVEPLAGGAHNCLGGPPVVVSVDLGETLGDRVLIDGSCVGSGPAATTSYCGDGGRRWSP